MQSDISRMAVLFFPFIDICFVRLATLFVERVFGRVSQCLNIDFFFGLNA